MPKLPHKPNKLRRMNSHQGPLAKLEKDAEELDALGKVLRLLPSVIGVRLADGTTLDNFLDRLHQGLLTVRAHREEERARNEELDAGLANRKGEGKTEVSTAGLAMSLCSLVETGRMTPTEHQRVRRMSLSDQQQFIASRKSVPRGTFELSEAEQKRVLDLALGRNRK